MNAYLKFNQSKATRGNAKASFGCCCGVQVASHKKEAGMLRDRLQAAEKVRAWGKAAGHAAGREHEDCGQTCQDQPASATSLLALLHTLLSLLLRRTTNTNTTQVHYWLQVQW